MKTHCRRSFPKNYDDVLLTVQCNGEDRSQPVDAAGLPCKRVVGIAGAFEGLKDLD